MDILSHGLWGGLAFGKRNRRSFGLSFVFGVAPDLLSFGIYFVGVFLGLSPRPSFHVEPPQDNLIPSYVHSLYNITHSLITFVVLFGLLWLILRRPMYEFLAWGLHILFDIPTHSYAFFPTPFLWPLSSAEVNGIPWSHTVIMIPNVILLVLLYSYYFVLKPYLRKRKLVLPPKP